MNVLYVSYEDYTKLKDQMTFAWNLKEGDPLIDLSIEPVAWANTGYGIVIADGQYRQVISLKSLTQGQS